MVQTESEMEMKVSELPANVLAYIKANYSGVSVRSSKITKANGEMILEAEIKGKDLLLI